MVYNVRKKTFPSGLIQYKFYTCTYCVGVNSNNNLNSKTPEEILEQKKSRSIDSLKSSVKRSKVSIYDLARCVSWDYFITLTLNSKFCDRFDYISACGIIKLFTKWCRRNNVVYLLVPEQHKDGAWHFHGLIFAKNKSVYDKMLVDSGHKDKQNTIYNIKTFSYGFTTATKVLDSKRVSSYISKYITKAFAVPKSKKRYWASRSIERPKETCYFYKDSLFEEIIAENCDYSKIILDPFSDDEVHLYEIYKEKIE